MTALHPSAWLLLAAVVLDLLFGDPVYSAHPVRLMGRTLTQFERGLRKIGLNGYIGGVILFLALAIAWCGATTLLIVVAEKWRHAAAMAVHLYLVYSLLALRDLLHHGWSVEKAARRGDLQATRLAIQQLVGRDTACMDIPACRRAAIESLSENLTDGFISPLFWYVIGGVPGIVLFKIVSTMDSMVGFKSLHYLRFGWCGARLDDLMNWLPARITWLMIALCAGLLPGCSATKALSVGWRHHGLVPGPNSGWSEAAAAGAIQRRIAGPIWKDGVMVSDIWLGDVGDPAAGDSNDDFLRAARIVLATGLIAVTLALSATLLR